MTATAPQRRVWQGIEADHPPAYRHDHADLLAMAGTMLEARRKRFPRLVERSQLDQGEADRQLAIFAAIEADWRWIVTGEGEPASIMTLHDRREALDASLSTIAGVASERGGFDSDLAHQCECVIAMRWHLEFDLVAPVHSIARFNHEMRRTAQEAPHAQ